AALIRATPTIFSQNPVECKALLSTFNDVSPLLRRLLAGSHSVIAGRLAGGMRALGLTQQADQIVGAMNKAYFNVRETNPFAPSANTAQFITSDTPAARQLRLRWASMRETVVAIFPEAPGLPGDPDVYLATIDKLYDADAYHSLSIENYEVSPELIARVKAGNWQPTKADEREQNALAARGYWDASLAVKASVQRILLGENAGKVMAEDVAGWFQELFGPSVRAGILRPADLAGYRAGQVYITNSRHIPSPPKGVFPLMETYFDLLTNEPLASVRVVLGHFFFGFIHPFMDGNGRIARFLMNAMLASGGYPWLIIRVEDRKAYMEALESASAERDIEPFARFLAERVGEIEPP
ncbi:MAG: Fic family protein, partial [Bacteroidota bacterium]